MKSIRFLILFLIEIILMVVALNAMLTNWAHFSFGADPIFHRISIPPAGTVWSRALWLGVLLLPPLSWFLGIVAWRRRPSAIQVRTADGETMLVHPGALIKLVRHQVGQHQAVSSFRVGVSQSGSKGIAVKGRISVKHLESLPAIKRELEASIREGFKQLMGIDKIDRIQLILDFDQKSLEDADSAYAPRPAAPKPEPPTRGALTTDAGAADDDMIAFDGVADAPADETQK